MWYKRKMGICWLKKILTIVQPAAWRQHCWGFHPFRQTRSSCMTLYLRRLSKNDPTPGWGDTRSKFTWMRLWKTGKSGEPRTFSQKYFAVWNIFLNGRHSEALGHTFVPESHELCIYKWKYYIQLGRIWQLLFCIVLYYNIYTFVLYTCVNG